MSAKNGTCWGNFYNLHTTKKVIYPQNKYEIWGESNESKTDTVQISAIRATWLKVLVAKPFVKGRKSWRILRADANRAGLE